MSSKRDSMMLPGDFSLEDFAMMPSEQIQNTDEDERAETSEPQPPEEQELRTDSRYYSLVSDRTSMRTFYTSRSSFASSTRDSIASHRQVPRKPKTPWQMTLREKNLLMSGFDETDWSGRGQHAEFGSDEDSVINDILRSEKILGHSATAVVERVRCKRILLARKKIRCNWRLKREQAIEEVACLQRLSHAHIVRCVGTYIQGRELSILLYPATSHNLETFLDRYMELSDGSTLLPHEKEQKSRMGKGLARFFKCLTSTLLYIHSQLIKHMDIKPTNILVETERGGFMKLYIADFGIARVYRHASDAETDSRTSFSKTFAAPEVVRQETRGFPADVFSLGCVFLEMLAVVSESKDAIEKLRQANVSGDMSYQANLDAIISCELLQDDDCAHANCRCVSWHRSDLVARIPMSSDKSLAAISGLSNCGVDWYPLKTMMRSMLNYDPNLRPTAQDLQDRLRAKNACCLEGAEPFQAAHLNIAEYWGFTNGTITE